MNCPYCGEILSEIPSLKENTISLICPNDIQCQSSSLTEKKFEVNISRLIYNIWNDATKIIIINNIELPKNKEEKEIKNFIKALLEQDNTNIDLENIIKNNELNKNLIGLWLFSYNEFTDTIETLDIFYPPLELKSHKAEEIKKRIEKVRIKGGQGTVGFIQRSGEPEILNNTQEDPRATVAVEDFLIRDFSWVGIPVPFPEIKNNEIKSSRRDTKLIVSFFVPYFNAWKNTEEVKKSLIENLRKYEDQLLLYKEKKNYENLLNCIVKSGRLKEGNISSETDLSGIYTEILKRIVEVSYLTFPIRYILFLTKDTSEEEFSVESLYLDFKNLSIDLHKKINLCYLQGKQHPCDNNKDCIANNLWNLFEERVQETIDIGGGFYFEFLLPQKDTQKINNNKNELLKPMKDYFELFIKNYNKNQIEEFEKKKIEDVITNLAHNIIDFLFSKIEKEDFKKELEILEKAVFPENKQNEREQLIGNMVGIKELFKDVLLCLFYKDVPYKISDINDKYKDKEELKEPATINVICKAIESKNGGIFERYKTLLQAKENKKLSMETGQIEINGEKINGEKLLAFSNDTGGKYLKYLGLNNLAIGEFIYKNFGRGEKIKIKEEVEEKLTGAQIDNNNLINTLDGIFILKKENGKDFYIYSTSISNKKITLLLKTTKEMEENLKNTIEEYIEGLIDELIEKIQQIEITKHALRSAVAAIMARNMSHQQSSAVIPYLLSLEGVKNKDKILTQYLSYIESRMDFVATAATMEFPKWGISVKFFKDLIVGLISQYGLIECLCKSEGHRYEDIQFKVYINDNEDLLEKNINTVNEKDVDVWIPGGFTGMHAFYLILENIMRNTAKYNKKDNKLIVSIKLIEKDDSYIVQVWDNLSTEIQKVEEFNKTFKESLIKPTGEKREYAWGFAEMRICATFLISGTEKEAAGKLSESEKCPIKAIEVNEGGQKRIGYEFKLKKPKLLEVYNES